jgi:DNA-binding transcriptional MerR regulator
MTKNPQEHSPLTVYLACDIADALQCSTSNVKRLTEEIRLDVFRTPNGTRIYTQENLERLKQEQQRKRSENWR